MESIASSTWTVDQERLLLTSEQDLDYKAANATGIPKSLHYKPLSGSGLSTVLRLDNYYQ